MQGTESCKGHDDEGLFGFPFLLSRAAQREEKLVKTLIVAIKGY